MQVRGQESAKYTVQLKIYNNNFFLSVYFIEGAFIKRNGKSWDFVPTGGPPPRKLGHLKVKKFQCLFCILDYSEHFNFS